MSDFKIDVGFDTGQLKNAINGSAGGGGASGSNAGGSGTIAKGFSAAMKTLGILGLLSQIKIVMDIIAFSLGTISSMFSFILVKFVQGLFKFFDDPVRGLIGLGVFIVNHIVDGLNLIVMAVNALIPGTSRDISLIPNLNVEDVLKLYDEAVAAAKANAESLIDAGNVFDLTVTAGVNIVKQASLNALEKQAELYDTISRKAEELMSEIDGGSSRSVYRSSGSTGSTFDNLQNFTGKMSRDPIVEQKRRDANAILKYLS